LDAAISTRAAGADIELDGAFVGNTPSTIGVTPGDHTIVLVKAGDNTWQHQVKVTAGTITPNIELEVAAMPLARGAEK
jgi:hypothetical protein